MMIASYVWGQKHYPVPYPVKKLAGYLTLVVIGYVLHLFITWMLPGRLWVSVILGILLMLAFAAFVYKVEKKDISRFVGK